MAKKCRFFYLTTTQINKFNSTGEVLNKPSKTVSIIGDGNCFYRILSWWITESEDHHLVARQRLAAEVINKE